MAPRFAVKRETRILGLDLCDPSRIIGAVVRGGLYLDGVLTLPSEARLKNNSIAYAILQTRFFPELRVIMMHDPKARSDSEVIERLTNLPVIQVDERKRNRGGFKSYTVASGRLQAKSSLPPEVLLEILSTAWMTGMLPEPVRIAHMISKARFFGKNARL